MKSLIVAMDRNNAIGFANDLPWGRGLKDDLANFKKLTTGASVIMGRKTFESIGSRPLPNRENIVVSRTPTGVKGVLTAGSLDSAYALARYPIFVIGGGQIYKQALSDMDVLYVTRVDAEFVEADVFFPEIDMTVWREVSWERYEADERNMYNFDIVKYERT
jgi:dihydrofolate reductase